MGTVPLLLRRFKLKIRRCGHALAPTPDPIHNPTDETVTQFSSHECHHCVALRVWNARNFAITGVVVRSPRHCIWCQTRILHLYVCCAPAKKSTRWCTIVFHTSYILIIHTTLARFTCRRNVGDHSRLWIPTWRRCWKVPHHAHTRARARACTPCTASRALLESYVSLRCFSRLSSQHFLGVK